LLALGAASSLPAYPTSPVQPSDVPVALPAVSVLDAGDRMARLLATTSTIPSDLDITLDKVMVRASAGQCFLLFCDFLASAYANGAYPEYTQLERFPISSTAQPEPALPVASPLRAPEKPLAVQTSRLVAQCRPAADMVRRTHSLPGGIWVQGHRLRPAEFLGAMATILQQLRYFGVAPDLVAVRPYKPPARWLEAVSAVRSAPTPPPATSAAQFQAPPGQAPAPQAASLRLIPSKDQVVKGLTPITAIYHGPEAFLRLRIDGRQVAVSNVSPFTYVWDTRLDAEGPHVVAAEALSQGKVLAQASVALTAQNGGPAL